MNADQVAALRVLLAPTGWLDRTRYFARTLRDCSRTPQGLLVVGTPDDEPWSPPPGAPAHLRVGLERLAAAGRSETLLVVSPQAASEELLERVSDVRRAGATIFSLDRGDSELGALAHEALAVPEGTAPLSFDAAQHLVTAAAGDSPPGGRRTRPASGGSSLRSRLAQLLDTVSGPPPGSAD
jgi:hypothetical protein